MAAEARRYYAAPGGVYVTVVLLWLWLVRVNSDKWDLIGATVVLVGMAIIAFAPRG